MFKLIKDQVNAQFAYLRAMAHHKQLLQVSLDNNQLFDAYIAALPEEERQGHTCNCCRQFLNHYGNVIALVNGKVHTLWDFEVGDIYKDVPAALSALVRAAPIDSAFFSHEQKLGTDSNKQLVDDKVIIWTHFSHELPNEAVLSRNRSIDAEKGTFRTQKETFKRALDEITEDAVNTVLELIGQNSLYRGAEYKHIVETFKKHQRNYGEAQNGELFAWEYKDFTSGIRNSAIGTLLVDLSEGKDVDYAVTAFEAKVAPANYKRTTAVATPAMRQKAVEALATLGLDKSLRRRYATLDDVPVSKVLFADRGIRKEGILEDFVANAKVSPKSFSKVEEVPVATFLSGVLPTADSLEVLVENRFQNYASLITAVDADAPLLFSWDNPVSWAYQGDVTDSVKERVKQAGGKVDGELRISLGWYNYDDLDLHVIEPNGHRIYFSNKMSYKYNGGLDVDMNAGTGTTREAVENVIFLQQGKMLEGLYRVLVNNYVKRENKDAGFEIEIECQDQLLNFSSDKSPTNTDTIEVCEFEYSKQGGIISYTGKLAESTKAPVSKEVWGLHTNQFKRVSLVVESPNHWDENDRGNHHLFFILDGAKNPVPPRGFFNEFLRPELHEHRKSMELLGGMLTVEDSPNQLSGLGFSSTQRNNVLVRVYGATTRVIRVIF